MGIVRSVEAVLGPDVYQRTLDELPLPVRDALRYGQITPSSWVSMSWHAALHEAMITASRSGPTVCRRVAKHTTEEHFRTIYRVFARLIGPEDAFAKASSILGTYYSHAKIEIRESRKGYVCVDFRQCIGFTPAIWENICGACEAVLEICGAQTVRLRIIAGAKAGDDWMTIEARWL